MLRCKETTLKEEMSKKLLLTCKIDSRVPESIGRAGAPFRRLGIADKAGKAFQAHPTIPDVNGASIAYMAANSPTSLLGPTTSI
jgi:hypothetical protein